MLRVLDIVEGTSVDGPGLRTSIYFAGCAHRCEGCHNPESWDPRGGRETTVAELMAVIEENGFNVTFSGGDPFLQPAGEFEELAAAVRKAGYTLWIYTGYDYETVWADEARRRVLEHAEVLVDGRFVMAERDTGLLFRGSRNQRLVDVARSAPGRVSIWGKGFREP